MAIENVEHVDLAGGEREAAAREAKIVLRSQPTNLEAMKLLEATGGGGE
jgi:hypothetical protein